MSDERMGDFLLAIEAKAHRRGWDAEPALLGLYRGDAPDVLHRRFLVRRGYAAAPIAPAQALEPNAAHAVYIMACNMTAAANDPLIRYVVGGLRSPGFLGVALLFEAWGWHGTAEEREALGGRDLADTPGAVECRQVMAATTTGLWFVNRLRGEEPKLTQPGDDGLRNVEGSVPESLAAITAAVAGTPAPDSIRRPHGWERRVHR